MLANYLEMLTNYTGLSVTELFLGVCAVALVLILIFKR